MNDRERNLFYSELLEDNIIGIKNNSFVCNDYKEGKQVLNNLIFHLSNCDEFLFSVAFITDSGLAKLKLKLKELESKNIKGKILTTNYLFFSEPKALKDLMHLNNVEIRMYRTDNGNNNGFHTKGYIFKKEDKYTAIVGSSNLTQNALTVNEEWNTEITGSKNAIAIKDILTEFDLVWNKSTKMEEMIDVYEEQYNQRILSSHQSIEEQIKNIVLQPNAMQNAFIVEFNKLLSNNGTKGLLISSTGTGKTFASAFALRQIKQFDVNKVLYITHRETILKQAKETYERVFGDKIKASLFTGNNELVSDANYIFASFSMLIRKEHREQFKQDEFDIVIIDEVHKVGENKYQDIINYFKPKFLLGMSATPDRTDGYDIYKLFDHNIIYEIRLMMALESNMLTPFNYFGIQDITVNGQTITDDDYKLENFNRLTADERVKNIIAQAQYYGFSGTRLKGLIFVHNVNEGRELSRLLNQNNYRTAFLDGSSSQEAREEAIKKLEQEEDNNQALDYILTRDIFNEGVDIPSVNQIILLRPTESSIIFIQQLGRGLRLWKGKEYVTVLDFIGNYTNNFLITKAFSKSKNSREDIIKPVTDILPGSSTVQFDEISKELIYKSIDTAGLSTKRLIFDEYTKVKNKFGRIPTLLEFEIHSGEPARVFLDKQIFKSYYAFLVEKETEFSGRLSDEQAILLSYISQIICDGKRKDYIDLLKSLIDQNYLKLEKGEQSIEGLNLISIFDCKFTRQSNPNITLIKKKDEKYFASDLLSSSLNNEVFKNFINQIIEVAYFINEHDYEGSSSLVPFQKYTRKDVCKLINHTKNEESTIYGYKEFKNVNTLPIFVSYNKKLEENSTVNYDDHFINEQTFVWFTRHDRTTNSNEIKSILDNYSKHKLRISIFIQKANSRYVRNEYGFYYVGDAEIMSYENENMSNGSPIVKFILKLKQPVKKDIYDYIISPLSIEDR